MSKKFYFFDSDALKNFHKRIFFSITIFFFLYLISFYRLFDVMLLEQQIHNIIDDNSFSERGNIYDRNGNLLATTIKSYSLSVNPQKIKDMEILSIKLSNIINIDQKQILEKINTNKTFVWLKKNISPTEHQKILDLGEIALNTKHKEQEERVRFYPFNNTASHVVGYTNTEGVGLSGIERGLNETLTKGNDVNLSIDINLQHAVRSELNKTINKFSAESGLSIIMDVKNGEILSMISLPDFDPNKRSTFNQINTFNAAIEANYEMGSVFKPITVAMGIDKGIIKSEMVFDVSKPIKGIEDFHPYKGSYNVKETIVNSSNIATAKIALKIGKKNQIDFFEKIGFDKKINFEILESATPLGNKNNWGDMETMTIGFGHGYAITPLHLINGYVSIINKSNKINPTLIKNNIKKNFPPIVKNDTSTYILKLLRSVILETKVTGPKIKIEGYEIGGKTGTAELINDDGQYQKDENMTSFVAIFPTSDPKYAVLTSVINPKKIEEANYSITAATVAAPLTKNIIIRMIEILGISESNNQEILKADTSNNYIVINNATF